MREKRTFAAMAAIVAVLLMLAAAYGLFYGGRVLPANGMTEHKNRKQSRENQIHPDAYACF